MACPLAADKTGGMQRQVRDVRSDVGVILLSLRRRSGCHCGRHVGGARHSLNLPVSGSCYSGGQTHFGSRESG